MPQYLIIIYDRVAQNWHVNWFGVQSRDGRRTYNTLVQKFGEENVRFVHLQDVGKKTDAEAEQLAKKKHPKPQPM